MAAPFQTVRKFRLTVRALYSASHQKVPAPTMIAIPSLRSRLFHFEPVGDEEGDGELAVEAAYVRRRKQREAERVGV